MSDYYLITWFKKGGNIVAFFTPGPEMLPLLKNMQSFMGPKGQTMVEGAMKLIDFITNEHGEELLKTLGQISSLGREEGKPVTVYTASGPVSINFNWSLVLFLIFILMVIPANPVHFGSVRSILRRK